MEPEPGARAADTPKPKPAPAPWSAQQLVRLEHEWRQLQRHFAYHPTVKVSPLKGNPPSEYQVDFQCRTLYVQEDGQLGYLDTPALHIWLPPGYPHEPPVVRPLHAVFHPNVTLESILIPPPWERDAHARAGRPAGRRAAGVPHVRPMERVEPRGDGVARRQRRVSADRSRRELFADCRRRAAGADLPATGEKTLAQLREQLAQMTDMLVRPRGTARPRRTSANSATASRLAVSLFSRRTFPSRCAPAPPSWTRGPRRCPKPTMTFEGLRQRHLAAAAALQAAAKVAESRRILIKELAEFEGLVQTRPSVDPGEAIDQLPDLPRMQAVASEFRVVVTEAQRRLATARTRLTVLVPARPPARADQGRAAGTADRGRDGPRRRRSPRTPSTSPTPPSRRSPPRSTAPGTNWPSSSGSSAGGSSPSSTTRPRELVGRIENWGGAGVQAYFVENEGGVFGPFEFEQRLDLGESALAGAKPGAEHDRSLRPQQRPPARAQRLAGRSRSSCPAASGASASPRRSA